MEKRGKKFIAPASIPRRIFAFAIDLILIGFIIILPFKRLFQRILPSDYSSDAIKYFQQNAQLIDSLSLLFLVIGIIILFYFTYFEYKIQQTPGKMLLGLYIFPENKLTFWNYLLSNLTFIPAFPFTILWIIDPIYMFISPKSQRIMERLNNIVVVQDYNVKP
jgi:uncharacterized RDD family membrane protein YckC